MRGRVDVIPKCRKATGIEKLSRGRAGVHALALGLERVRTNMLARCAGVKDWSVPRRAALARDRELGMRTCTGGAVASPEVATSAAEQWALRPH
jgi:hypothetical protein